MYMLLARASIDALGISASTPPSPFETLPSATDLSVSPTDITLDLLTASEKSQSSETANPAL